MAYRSDVYLLCTPNIGSELKKVTALAEKVYQPVITEFNSAFYFQWCHVPWSPDYVPFCKDIYDVLTKFDIIPEEGYKLIRFGEKTDDIVEEFNEQGYALFGEDFFSLRSIQLPSDL